MDRGFCYKTVPGVTIGDNKTAVLGTTGAYTLAPTLNVNTPYYFVAYAINAGGTSLSSPELNFWTLANTPTAPTVGNPAPRSLAVTIGSGDGNPAATAYAIQETTSGNYVQANGTLGTGAVYQTAAIWNPSGAAETVTNLTPSTAYVFSVIAQNGAGIVYRRRCRCRWHDPPRCCTHGHFDRRHQPRRLNGDIKR